MSVPLNEKKPMSPFEIEAALIKQEHRLYHVIRNFLNRNKNYKPNDPRYKASGQALVYKVVLSMIPTAAASSIGAVGFISLLIAWFSLASQRGQNRIEIRASLFAHSIEIQRTFVDKPGLYPYFYGEKPLAEAKGDEKHQVLTLDETFADMIDHAGSSDMDSKTWLAWCEYTRTMMRSSPTLKKFCADHKDWYRWTELLVSGRPKPKSWIDWATEPITY